MVGIPSLVESDRAIRADWLNPRSLSRAAWSGTGTRTSRPAALSASASAIAIAQRSDRWVQPRYLSAWAIDSAAPAYRTAATAVRPGGHSRQRPQSAGEPGRGSEQRRHPVARGRRVARHQRQTPGLALGNGSPQWTHSGGRSTSARAPIARGRAMAVARGETRGRNERNGGPAHGPRQTSLRSAPEGAGIPYRASAPAGPRAGNWAEIIARYRSRSSPVRMGTSLRTHSCACSTRWLM